MDEKDKNLKGTGVGTEKKELTDRKELSDRPEKGQQHGGQQQGGQSQSRDQRELRGGSQSPVGQTGGNQPTPKQGGYEQKKSDAPTDSFPRSEKSEIGRKSGQQSGGSIHEEKEEKVEDDSR